MRAEGGYFSATIKIAGTCQNNYPDAYPEGLIRFAAEQAVEAFESHLLNREIAVMKISITDERIRYPDHPGAIA